MLCMICKQKPAQVHLTEIGEGDKMKKVDLCEECAKHKGINDTAGYAIAGLFLGLGEPQEMAPAAGGEEIQCPACGFTQADFKKAGRLGCSECYTAFAEGLESLLKTMHKGTKHVGKTPRSLKQGRDLADRLKQLLKKLDHAVTDENFEQAASLRDEIRSTRDQIEHLAPGVKP